MKYKLTDQDGYTRKGESNETLWGDNVTHTATGRDRVLCTDGVIHYYDSPEIAVFMNPAHAEIKNPICWEGRGRQVAWDTLKGGCKTFTTLRRCPLPEITTEQRTEIAIRVALTVYEEPTFVMWAKNWLSGEDRTPENAAMATENAANTAWTATNVRHAARAAEGAAMAAESATMATENVVKAAWAAERAAWAAANVVRAAESAASATWAAKNDAAWAAARISTRQLTNIIRLVLGREEKL